MVLIFNNRPLLSFSDILRLVHGVLRRGVARTSSRPPEVGDALGKYVCRKDRSRQIETPHFATNPVLAAELSVFCRDPPLGESEHGDIFANHFSSKCGRFGRDQVVSEKVPNPQLHSTSPSTEFHSVPLSPTQSHSVPLSCAPPVSPFSLSPPSAPIRPLYHLRLPCTRPGLFSFGEVGIFARGVCDSVERRVSKRSRCFAQRPSSKACTAKSTPRTQR